MKTVTPIALLLATFVTAACGGEPDSTPTENPPTSDDTFFSVIAERERPTVDEVDTAAVERLEDVNTATAFRLYRKLRADSPNLIFSPLSISRVFANYPKSAAMEAVFGFTEENSTLLAWSHLYHLATDRSAFADVSPKDRSLFEAVDIYWTEMESVDPAAYPSVDAVHSLPLGSQPEESRLAINEWVEGRSRGMLKDFLEPGLITPATVGVATNLVYFVGAWPQEWRETTVAFEGGAEISAFTGQSGMRASVSEDMTVVQIPYAHGYNHWVLMPHADFESFADTLDEVRYAELRASAQPEEIRLTMPEFVADSKPPIQAAIDEIRKETGTDDGSTLSGAYMEAYVHQAAIELSKEGTRAAAVTAVIEYENNAPEPPEPIVVEIDRSFVHIIEDSNSKSILFLGEFTGK